MKKSTNISALKELVNNNVLDCVELRVNGVQAYNIAKAAAKVKAFTRRAAFDMSLLFVVVLCFVFFFACIPAINMMLQAAGIEGTACTLLSFFAILPAMDVTLWLECNALAVLARLFPCSFVSSSRPEFLRPCSIFAKMYRNL